MSRETPQEILHLVEVTEAPEGPVAGADVPVVFSLSDETVPSDVLNVLAMRPFASGEQPWSRSTRLEHVKDEAPLLPKDARLVRTLREKEKEAILAEGDGWTLLTNRWEGGAAYLSVTAVSEELAKTVLDECVLDATEPPKTDDTHVEMGFWHLGGHGPIRQERAISADSWEDIRGNYTAPVAEALDRVMELTREEVSGRLLLLHGPPGTGKTTALRALARAWGSWCQADCVLDPESLFGTTGYLMKVAVGMDDDEAERRWRLLILEDCDELIRGEAKQSTGQGLSRLLNLTDGMLGQGRDVLVAITTNEDLARLHPAVVRPGRCLAQVEVGPLTREESVAWLDGTDAASRIGPEGATLAELAALRRGEDVPVADRETSRSATGFYL